MEATTCPLETGIAEAFENTKSQLGIETAESFPVANVKTKRTGRATAKDCLPRWPERVCCFPRVLAAP